MALTIGDRVQETTTTTGTGTITLAGAKTGYQAASSVLSNADTTYYAIQHQTEDEWEVGLGTYTSSGTTLARTTVISSSNSNNAVDFAAGTKDVFVTMPASKLVYLDASGNPVGLAPAHVIQEEGSNLTARTRLNFVGAAVTATDDSGNDATKITIAASNASLPFTRSDGSTSDPIALSSAAIGESLVTDTSPQLGGDLDVNGQSIVSASNGNINIAPNGSGVVQVGGTALLANDTNDRITTATGSGTFNAEANLTFDGSTLAVTGALSATGNVAIGTASADTKLHLYENTSTGTEAQIKIQQDGTGDSAIFFKAGADWSIGTDNSASDAFVISASSNLNAAPKVSILTGGGITFNGDTAAANAIDDYEEGTWTAVLNYHVSGSNTSYTCNENTGRYVKIGRLVFVTSNINVTNPSASNDASHGLQISGLPFTVTNDTACHSRMIFDAQKYNGGSTMMGITSYAIPNTTLIQPLIIFNNGSTWTGPRTDHFYQSSGSVGCFVTGCYRTDD